MGIKKLAPLVSDEEMHHTRLRQLCHVFGLADSTLAGHRVVCKVGAPGALQGAPAASSAGEITFDGATIRDVNTTEGLVKVNGLNYHELSHILFTPQQGKLRDGVIDDGTFAAFNVLEDQRIESLLVAKYPSVTPYLIATVAEYFADTDPAQHGNSWPYLYGRKYLPKNMRDYFEGEAYDPALGMSTTMQTCERIIDAYCKLNTCDDSVAQRARQLVQQFANIIGQQQRFSPFGHQNATGPATGGAKGMSQAQQSQGTVSAQGAAGAQGNGQQQNASGKGGSGAGGSGSGAFNKGNAQKALKGVASAQAGQSTVQADVRRQREAMNRGRIRAGGLENPKRGLVDVDDEVRVVARKFGKQLQQMVVDSDPGWHTHQPTGRINVQRAMHGSGLDDVFDSWDSGKQDADSLEMVVMGDASGSMDRIIGNVADCLWMFKFGAEQMGQNAQVTVMEFESRSRYVYAPGERAHPTQRRDIGTGGSTNPAKAIDECMRIMHLSPRKRKLVLFVTDGIWDGGGGWGVSSGLSDPHREKIELMNAHGITTACVFLVDDRMQRAMDGGSHLDTYGSAEWRDDNLRHGCKVFTMANGVGDLSLFGRALVKATVRK